MLKVCIPMVVGVIVMIYKVATYTLIGNHDILNWLT